MEKTNINLINPNFLFQTLLLSFCLLTFIKAEFIEKVTYDINNNSATYIHTSGNKTQIIKLELNPDKIPLYMKITIIPDKDTPTPLLCFSSKDPNCNTDRQILSKRTDGLSSMIYIKREHFINGGFYIFVTCEESGCGYTIEYEGTVSAEIDANSVFSYIATNYNRKMSFTVIGDAEEGSFLTIGVEGSSKVSMSVENIFDSPFFF